MTDGYLMDAECWHGIAWYDCVTCCDEVADEIEDVWCEVCGCDYPADDTCWKH